MWIGVHSWSNRFSILHRHDEVFHDVIFALGGVLAHVEGEDAGGFGLGGVFDFADAQNLGLTGFNCILSVPGKADRNSPRRESGMANTFQYDVFLCNSSNDKPVVREIADRFRKDGLEVWCDEPEIPVASVCDRPGAGERSQSAATKAKIGGPDELRTAVNQLQELIYAP